MGPKATSTNFLFWPGSNFFIYNNQYEAKNQKSSKSEVM
jgi:hypothetical protein